MRRIRVSSRMRLTPARMAKARPPAPEQKTEVASAHTFNGKQRTQSSSTSVFRALPQVIELNRFLSSIPPHDFPSLSEALLIVRKRDQVLK